MLPSRRRPRRGNDSLVAGPPVRILMSASTMTMRVPFGPRACLDVVRSNEVIVANEFRILLDYRVLPRRRNRSSLSLNQLQRNKYLPLSSRHPPVPLKPMLSYTASSTLDTQPAQDPASGCVVNLPHRYNSTSLRLHQWSSKI